MSVHAARTTKKTEGVTFRAARHDRRSVSGTVLAAADAHGHVDNPFLGDTDRALLRKFVPFIAAVNQDVARLEERSKGLNHFVNHRSGSDEEHELARLCQRRHELRVVLEPDKTHARILSI
jgi:hypothetical protein